MQVDLIPVGLVLPSNDVGLSFVGKMKGNVSRPLRLRYPGLKRTEGGAGWWSPGFFSSTGGLNEAVIGWYVEHQEQVATGQIQLELDFECHAT
ncbi:MAG: hypothetical protein MRJ67_03995 [Nitrospirales bacterium]|nr:hypothetical protein [Nitrospirales bacterium]